MSSHAALRRATETPAQLTPIRLRDLGPDASAVPQFSGATLRPLRPPSASCLTISSAISEAIWHNAGMSPSATLTVVPVRAAAAQVRQLASLSASAYHITDELDSNFPTVNGFSAESITLPASDKSQYVNSAGGPENA